MASIGELFVELGFDVDTKKLDDFNDRVKDTQNSILKMAAVATGGVYALNAFMESAGQRALSLKQFTAETGYSAEALQKWALAINLANPAVPIEQAIASYKKLAQTIIDIRQGRGDSGALAMLGVQWNPNMTPEQVLSQVSAHLQDTINRYGVGMTTQLLDRIGIGAGALNALKLSAGDRDNITRGLVPSEEDVNRLVQYEKSLALIGREWDKFKMDLTSEWAPMIIEEIHEIEAAFKKWLPVLGEIIKEMGGWKTLMEIIIGITFGRWALGIVADLALVSLAFGRLTIAAGTTLAAIAPIAATVAALPAGIWAGSEAAKRTGAAQAVADFLQPVGGKGILDPNKPHPWLEWAFGESAPQQTPQKLQQQRFLNPPGGTGGGNSSLPPPPGAPAFAGITNNNTFNIHSRADAEEIAEEAARILAQQNSTSYQQLDLGPNH